MKLDTPSDNVVEVVGTTSPMAGNVSGFGNFTPSWMAWVSKVTNFIVWRSQAGTTAQRPTKGLEIGSTYYDTTLGFLICVHQVTPAVVWHNGAGIPV